MGFKAAKDSQKFPPGWGVSVRLGIGGNGGDLFQRPVADVWQSMGEGCRWKTPHDMFGRKLISCKTGQLFHWRGPQGSRVTSESDPAHVQFRGFKPQGRDQQAWRTCLVSNCPRVQVGRIVKPSCTLDLSSRFYLN